MNNTSVSNNNTNAQMASDMRARVRRWYFLVIGSSFFWLFLVMLASFYSIAFFGITTGLARFSFFGSLFWFAIMCVCYFGLTAHYVSFAPLSSAPLSPKVYNTVDYITLGALHCLSSIVTVLAVLSIFGSVTNNMLYLACHTGWICVSAPLLVTVVYGVVFGWMHREPEHITFPVLQKAVSSKIKRIVAQCFVSPSGVFLPLSLIFFILIINLRAWIWQFDHTSFVSFKCFVSIVVGSLFANFFTKVMYQLVEAFWTKPVSFDAPHASRQRNAHLIAALCDETNVANSHAYFDLYSLARQSPPRRSSLYLDDNGMGWVTVITTITKQIEELTCNIRAATDQIIRVKPNQSVSVKPSNKILQVLDEFQGIVDRFINDKSLQKPLFDPSNAVENTKTLFGGAQVYSWAIPALSTLLVHSREEDKFGVAVHHQSLPSVLCSLIDCLSANEDFIKAAIYYIYRGNSNQFAQDMDPVFSPFNISDLLTSATYSLVTNFYSSISFYKYPPKVTERLKHFVDFKE